MKEQEFWGPGIADSDPEDRSFVGASGPVDPLRGLDPRDQGARNGDPHNGEPWQEPALDPEIDVVLDKDPVEVVPAVIGPKARIPEEAPRDHPLHGARAPILDADIVIHRDGFTLDVRLAIGPGETVAVVGPNGSGKSTLISAIAGFLGITFGSITLNGVVVDGPQTKIWLPPEKRELAMVPQDGLLLPHLSAIANVGYGLKHRGGDPHAAKAALQAVGLAKKRRVKPAKLSGGEQQRVALARAVVLHQPLLILDEPFSKVDSQIRPELRDWVQAERPPGQAQLVITHGADHAFEADLVIALEEGSVAAVGQPAQLAAEPPTEWLRTFFA